MKDLIPVPSKGTPLRATWGAAVANGMNAFASMSSAGMLSREGLTGTGSQPLPTNRRDRKAPSDLHPWKVFAMSKSEEVDHCFEIYLPEGVVHVGEVELDVEGVTAVTNTDDRYKIDCESEIEGNGSFILAVFRESEEEQIGVSSSEEAETSWTAKIISDVEEIEDASEVLAVLPVADVSISTDGEYPSGSVTRQLVRSAVAFSGGSTGIDDVSIGNVTDEEAEDPSAIQVKDFDNDESDGGHGLAERLKVVKEGEGESSSYAIQAESNESKVHLVARVNGKIKYIPLTGSKKKDEDEENPPEEDPCAHDPSKGNGGVSPDDEEDGAGGAGGFDGGAGGVSPSDASDSHTGDDNCNCN